MSDYDKGRKMRRDNAPPTACEGAETKNGYWYQDAFMEKIRTTNSYGLVKPQVETRRIGVWE